MGDEIDPEVQSKHYAVQFNIFVHVLLCMSHTCARSWWISVLFNHYATDNWWHFCGNDSHFCTTQRELVQVMEVTPASALFQHIIRCYGGGDESAGAEMTPVGQADIWRCNKRVWSNSEWLHQCSQGSRPKMLSVLFSPQMLSDLLRSSSTSFFAQDSSNYKRLHLQCC